MITQAILKSGTKYLPTSCAIYQGSNAIYPLTPKPRSLLLDPCITLTPKRPKNGLRTTP